MSYGIVGKPGAGIQQPNASVLNLVCYVSLCEDLRAGAGSLSYIVHVDCCGLSTIVIKKVITATATACCCCHRHVPRRVMSVGQDGRRPPTVSREQPSPEVRAPVQWMGTGWGMHISKHTRVASAAVAGGDEIASQLHRR